MPKGKKAQAAVCTIAGMTFPDHSDEELAERARTTKEESERDLLLNELLRRNLGIVARWCLRFTNDREMAADLSQEILTKAYLNLNQFEGKSKFSTWLFTIARHHCLNATRANTRQATSLRADHDEEFLASMPDLAATPYGQLESKQTSQMLAALLQSGLDDTERAVFTLHFGEEMPVDVITRLLNLQNASGAKAYLVSAKRKLARLVKKPSLAERLQ